MRTQAKAKHLYVESKRGAKKKVVKYVWKEPIPLSMNVYILEEDEVLQMILRDRRIKEDRREMAEMIS